MFTKLHSVVCRPKLSRPRLTFAVAALSCLPFADRSNASQTVTSTFTVQMTVQSSCVINSTSTMDFGTAGVLTTNVDSTSTLAVQCTNTTPYDIGLDVGLGTGATVAVRKMTSGSATVNYSLYKDSARTVLWGNTIGTDTQHATGNGGSQSYTVYGRVPAQTTPAAAGYTDTITVTVTY
jgi:spore coat protein U-like protein